MIEKIKPKDFPYSPNEYVVVNTGGASEYRKYKHSAMALNNIGLPVVQIGDSTDPACVGALDLRDRLSWKESAWVMAHAKVALAVDSFCAHLAGAVDTPAVVLFGPAPARVTKPWYSDERNLICMQPNMPEVCPITSHCYSNTMGRNKCTSPCINTISPMKVRENLCNLIKGE
jgi:ADP-heptose:LPS heptosyltransferase